MREGLHVPQRAALAAAALIVALIATWAVWQPLRSQSATDDALAALEKKDVKAARADAQAAQDRNPLAVEPLFDLAAIQQAAGQNNTAKQTLDQAIDLEPANPETWRQLGAFQLAINDPAAALRSYQIAYFLDPRSKQSTTDIVVASRLAAARQGG